MESPTVDLLKLPISISMEKISKFCQRRQITELSLFGSVLRDNFRPDSDIDILVTFAQDTTWSLFDLVKMEDELEDLFNRKVDLVMKRSIQKSHNWIRRKEILSMAQVIYEA